MWMAYQQRLEDRLGSLFEIEQGDAMSPSAARSDIRRARSGSARTQRTKACFSTRRKVRFPLSSAQTHCPVNDGWNMGRRSCGELAMARSTSEVAAFCAASSA